MCNYCRQKILISKIANTGETIELVPNRVIRKENLGNMCYYDLILGCGLECADSLPVTIGLADVKVPVLDKFGNTVYFNQIRRTRYRYCISYGNNGDLKETGQFVIHNCLCLPSVVDDSNPFIPPVDTHKTPIKGVETK